MYLCLLENNPHHKDFYIAAAQLTAGWAQFGIPREHGLICGIVQLYALILVAMVKSNPESTRLEQEAIAHEHKSVGRYDDAIKLLEQLADTYDDVRSVFAFASALYDAGYDNEALERLIEFLQRNPGDIDAGRHYGEFLLKAGQIEEAMTHLEKARNADPHNARTLASLGRAQEFVNNYHEAKRCYMRAVSEEPGSVDLRVALALQLLNLGEHTAAEREFTHALKLDSESISALQGLSRLRIAEGRHEDALPLLNHAIRAHPEDFKALMLRAAVYGAQGKLAGAISDLKEALALQPCNSEVCHDLAIALHRRGDTRNAIDTLNCFQSEHGFHTSLIALESCLLAHVGDSLAKELTDPLQLVMETSLGGTEDLGSGAFVEQLLSSILVHPTLAESPALHTTRNGQQTGNLFLKRRDIFTVFENKVRNLFAQYVRRLDVGVAPRLAAMLKTRRKAHSVGWAVVLRSQGHQTPHIHPGSLLSGVCYLQLPSEIQTEAGRRDGWLQFGLAPPVFGCNTESIQSYVKPEVGKVIIFPSYLFHNTIPFKSSSFRVSIAFDMMMT